MLRYRFGKVEFHEGIDDLTGLPHPDHHGQQSTVAPNINMAGADTSAVAAGNGQGIAPPFNQPFPQGPATSPTLSLNQSGQGTFVTSNNLLATPEPTPKTWGDLGAGVSGALGGVADVMGLGQTTDTAGQIGYQERTEFSPDPTWEAWAAPPVPTHEEVVRADQDFFMNSIGLTFADVQGNRMPTTRKPQKGAEQTPKVGVRKIAPSGEEYIFTGSGHLNGWQRVAELGPEAGLLREDVRGMKDLATGKDKITGKDKFTAVGCIHYPASRSSSTSSRSGRRVGSAFR